MVVNAFKIVFRSKAYTLLAGIVMLAVFAFAVWLPNIRLLFSLISDPAVPVSVKLTFPLRLLGSITTNFTPFSASYTIIISILFGINAAMLVFYLRRRINYAKQAGVATGFIGIASGILGMGCAACGSFILTSTLSLIGAAGIITSLPLKGGEFGIFGIILLSISLFFTAKQIQNPAICKISQR